ncbi:hypothetical protein [Paenibacillus polymyxa]|uniref:hypothetical protein n=1 Tax=Paenibacillus polymyxa TaxID=1406 RepID=UPI0002E57A1A|nr:hypothetical protein [Paenibacillus polymyxa]WOZ41007.1 hypothetical protein RQP19_16565 [Paenibacillus polymyxa]
MSVFGTYTFGAVGGNYSGFPAYSFIDENSYPTYGIAMDCIEWWWISLVLA